MKDLINLFLWESGLQVFTEIVSDDFGRNEPPEIISSLVEDASSA